MSYLNTLLVFLEVFLCLIHTGVTTYFIIQGWIDCGFDCGFSR